MSASRPAPVVALEATRAAAAPSAATVIMFGRPGLAGRGVPGVFANYSRKNRIPAAPLHPMLSRGLAPAADPEHHAERYTPELIAEGVTV